MSPAARRKLLSFDWPGNVRQLRNVVESMVVVDYDGLLDADDLPEEFSDPAEPIGESSTGIADGAGRSAAGRAGKDVRLRDASSDRRQSRGSRQNAGIGERTLYRKIKEFGL